MRHLQSQGMAHLFINYVSIVYAKSSIISLPKNPVKNRKTTNPAKLSTRDAGTQSIVYMKSVIMYGGFLPIAAILEDI